MGKIRLFEVIVDTKDSETGELSIKIVYNEEFKKNIGIDVLDLTMESEFGTTLKKATHDVIAEINKKLDEK